MIDVGFIVDEFRNRWKPGAVLDLGFVKHSRVRKMKLFDKTKLQVDENRMVSGLSHWIGHEVGRDHQKRARSVPLGTIHTKLARTWSDRAGTECVSLAVSTIGRSTSSGAWPFGYQTFQTFWEYGRSIARKVVMKAKRIPSMLTHLASMAADPILRSDLFKSARIPAR